MATKFQSYLMRDTSTPLSQSYFNPIWKDLDGRLDTLEQTKISWDAAVDDLTKFGLVRIDNTLAPVIDAANEQLTAAMASAALLQSMIDDLDVQGQLDAAIADVNDALAAQSAQVTSDLTALQTQVDTDLNALQTTLESEMADLQSQVDTDIADLQASVTAALANVVYQKSTTTAMAAIDDSSFSTYTDPVFCVVADAGLYRWRSGTSWETHPEYCITGPTGQWVKQSIKLVTQASHGFSAKSQVCNTGSWVTAKADVVSTSLCVWTVVHVLDSSNFVVQKEGIATIPSHGLTGTQYLSKDTAGALTATKPVGSTTKPLGFYLPVLTVLDSNTVQLFGHSRPVLNPVYAEYVESTSNATPDISFSNLDLNAIGDRLDFEWTFWSEASQPKPGLQINGQSGASDYLYLNNVPDSTDSTSDHIRMMNNSGVNGTNRVWLRGSIMRHGSYWAVMVQHHLSQGNDLSSAQTLFTASNITSLRFFDDIGIKMEAGNKIRLFTHQVPD